MPESFLQRGGVQALKATAALLVLQFVTSLVFRLLEVAGVHQRTHRHPRASKLQLLCGDVVGAACYAAPTAFLETYLSLSWSFSAPNFVLLGSWAFLMTLMVDSYFYWMHRWFHSNKLAFKLFHARHHHPDGNLGVETAFFLDPVGALIEGGLPGAAICLLTHKFCGANWWFFNAAVLEFLHIALIGHAGVDAHFKHPLELLVILLDPMLMWYHLSPCMHLPADHEQHHRDPKSNYAPFFSFWDDITGTRSKACCQLNPSTPLNLAAHTCYMVAVFGGMYLALTRPLQALAAYVLLYLVVPPGLVAAVFNALHVPEGVRAIMGGLMDCYRSDNAVTYAAPGQPGSWDSASKGSSQAVPVPIYIFGCHPTGILSRSALLTFAARGWSCPTAGLGRVRFAVSRTLLHLPIPFSREVLLACGCVPADRAALKQHLLSGTSVALTPGGWSEATHTGGYDLLLKDRTGFVKLALETRAALVPVLCLGEHLVGSVPHLLGKPGFFVPVTNWLVRTMSSQRPKAVQVVFGAPVSPHEGESVRQLHQRYTASLLALGKQHGVELNIA